MKAHTQAFKDNVCLFGRELDSIITYTLNDESIELGSEELNSVSPHYQGSILKSVMKQLDIDSNIEIPVGTELNYQFGVKIGEDEYGNVYEYIDFGNYIVYSVEKQEDTGSYKITCYDKMLYSMIEYNNETKLNITYPITIRDYINAICNKLGLVFKNVNNTFANYNKQIQNELYLDASSNSLGYTYRDILDELAQVTASTICINEDDDELEIRYINNTNDTIDEEYLKDINVNFGERYGAINTIVLSRSAGSDNVYYPSVLPANPIEIKISDNQIMNGNDRADYLPDIYTKLNGLQYYINDFSSTGICYYNLCDRYNIAIGENTYSCIMFNDEVNITQGLEENVYTEMPEESVTDYTKADKTDRRINQTYLIVDKQNQVIEAVVSQTNENTETIESIITTEAETEVGNPLYIENAQNSKPIEFELYGDTLQDGTPTPDNPINIDVVTGRQKISVGRNIYDPSFRRTNGTIQVSRGTVTESNGIFTFNLTQAGGYIWSVRNQGQEYTENAGKLYEFNADSYMLSITNSLFTNNYITYYDENKISLGYIQRTSSNIKISKSDKQGAKYFSIRYGFPSDVELGTYTFSVQLEQGEVATEYTPYKSYEINLGKNLFDKSGIQILNANTELTELDTGIRATKTGGNTYKYKGILIPNIQYLLGKQLTLKATITPSGTNNGRIAIYEIVNNEIYGNSIISIATNGQNQAVFTMPSSLSENSQGIALLFYSNYNSSTSNVGDYVDYTDVQLELGSQATSYSAYKEPIELCKIGDYQDKIFKRDNRWYLRKEISKVVLDGSEDWYSMSWTLPKFGARTEINNIKQTTSANDNCNCLSNYFKPYTQNNLYGLTNPNYGIANRTNNSEIIIRNDNVSSTTDLKTWLSTHNTDVYYILATPTEEPIIDEELISQLDAFELETGINNITNTSNNLAGDMYLKYYLQTPISDTYVNQVELKSELKITSNEITSMVSETYATKDDTTSTSNPNSLSSRISQTAKSISLSINNGSTTSGIVITTTKEDGTTEQASGTIEMTGLVKFTDLSTSNPTTTIINGDNITTGTIKSSNYVADTSGTKIDLSNGTIDTKDFKVSSTGNITSTGGTIGGWEIQSYGLTKSFGTNDRYVFEIRTDRASNIACLGVWDNNTSSSNFYLTPEGYLYARNGSIGGGMITETITGASINLYNNPGFLKMSLGDTNHPFVSALNVALGSGGISFRNSGSRDNVGGEIGHIYGSSAGNVVIEGDTGTWIQDINIQTNYIMNCYQLSGLQDAYIRQNYSIVLKPNPNGGAYIWGTESYNAILTVGGSPSTLSIKTNVEKKDTSDIPDMLKQIELYDYKYIDEINNGENDYGYIIDYLEKIEGINKYFVFNEIERNGLKYKTINHEHLSKFLLGAVIELQKEINSLKEEK